VRFVIEDVVVFVDEKMLGIKYRCIKQL